MLSIASCHEFLPIVGSTAPCFKFGIAIMLPRSPPSPPPARAGRFVGLQLSVFSRSSPGSCRSMRPPPTFRYYFRPLGSSMFLITPSTSPVLDLIRTFRAEKTVAGSLLVTVTSRYDRAGQECHQEEPMWVVRCVVSKSLAKLGRHNGNDAEFGTGDGKCLSS